MKINNPSVVFLPISSIYFHGSDLLTGVGFLPDLFKPNDNPVVKAIIFNPIPVISPDLLKILLSSDFLHSS